MSGGTTMAVAFGLLAAVVGAALVRIATDEVRGRLEMLPRLILLVAVRLSPADRRADLRTELDGELHVACHETDGLPLTRLCKGVLFSVGQVVATLRQVPSLGTLVLHAWNGVFMSYFSSWALFRSGPLVVVLCTAAGSLIFGWCFLRVIRGRRPPRPSLLVRADRWQSLMCNTAMPASVVGMWLGSSDLAWKLGFTTAMTLMVVVLLLLTIARTHRARRAA